MTEAQHAAIVARRAAITPPPWDAAIDGETGDVFVDMHDTGHDIYIANMEGSCGRCHANQEFIAHAPQDIDLLLDEIDRLRAKRKRPYTPVDRCALCGTTVGRAVIGLQWHPETRTWRCIDGCKAPVVKGG